jgi:hypothetical protein
MSTKRSDILQNCFQAHKPVYLLKSINEHAAVWTDGPSRLLYVDDNLY